MSDNNAIKGIGAATVFGLLLLRNCDNTADDALRGIAKNADEIPTVTRSADNFIPHGAGNNNGASSKVFDESDAIIRNRKFAGEMLNEDIFSKSYTSYEKNGVAEEIESQIISKLNDLYEKAKSDALTDLDKRDILEKYGEYKTTKNKLREVFESYDIIYLTYLKNTLNICNSV